MSYSELIKGYVDCAADLRRAVSGLTQAELKSRPVPGKWSTLEVVGHLVDTDIYFADRIERTIALDNPLLVGVDERPYPERIGFQDLNIDEELDLMHILRRRIGRILSRQLDETWQRTAIHTESGKVTLESIVNKAIAHVQHHLKFIDEKRSLLLDQRDSSSPHRKAHTYRAHVEWSNSGPDFLGGKYSRQHRWRFDSGIELDASASPQVVPAPWSVENAVDPEEALVAAASSCHMLTFLWLASKAKLSVESYIDDAYGEMTKNAEGIPWVSHIQLSPTIHWTEGSNPTAETVKQLHEKAHEQCFIAQSIKSRIEV